MKKEKSLLLYSLACLSGILLRLSFPPFSWGFLAWFGLILLFLAVHRAKNIRQAANISGLAGLLLYGIGLSWFFKLFGLFAIGLICILALFIVLVMVVIKRTEERVGIYWAWLVVAPVVWVGVEYFRSEIWFLRFTWFGVGYSQINNLILQTASIWGTYGISFFIVLSAGCIIIGFTKGFKYIWIGISIPILCWIWGLQRIYTLPAEYNREIQLALIQDESFSLRQLLVFEQDAINQGAEIIVWPEYSVQLSKDLRELELLKYDIDKKVVIRIVGVFILHNEESLKKSSLLTKRSTHNQIENFALLLNEKGEILGRYDKIRPIPIIEKRVKPGKTILPFSTPKGKLGIQICYDLDFEYGTRKLVQQGAQLILVPNLDPVSYGRLQHQQHSSMTPMRAVESGLWVARAASSGISQIISPTGKIIKSLGINKEGVLMGKVYLKQGGTIYTKVGWLLAPICMYCSLFLITLSFLARTHRISFFKD